MTTPDDKTHKGSELPTRDGTQALIKTNVQGREIVMPARWNAADGLWHANDGRWLIHPDDIAIWRKT